MVAHLKLLEEKAPDERTHEEKSADRYGAWDALTDAGLTTEEIREMAESAINGLVPHFPKRR